MKKQLASLFTIVLLGFSWINIACTADDKKVDKQFENSREVICNKELAENDGDPNAIIDCKIAEINDKEKQINTLIKEIQTHLPDNEKKKMQQSQLDWMEYKNKEKKRVYSIFSDLHGHIQSLNFAVAIDLQLTESRKEILSNYLSRLKEF